MARRNSPSILAFVAALAFAAGSACDGGSQSPNSAPKSGGKPIGGAAEGKPIGGAASAGDPAGDSAGGGETRTPMLAADHPQYGRREGTSFKNDCSADANCLVGGCGSEVCSADPGVMSTCELLPGEVPATAACGCVSGQCIWYTTNGETMAPAPSSGGVVDGGGSPGAGDSGGDPGGGVQCGEAVCAKGEECIEYYGIAGPSGPKFKTCGIPCGPKKTCPAGKKCVTVADGPGDVCQ
jgi:eight-cysteine-cluster-containing protein